MSSTIDPRFMDEIKRYGDFEIRACYSCGHCAGTCPLVQWGESFPRRLIRYAQLGLRDKLGASKAVWSCYYCGECSKTCPRQATPGEFMDAARRYFISHWDVTTLSRRLYTSPKFAAIFMGLLAVFFAVLFLATGRGMGSQRLALFQFVNVELLHYAGIVVMVLVGLVLCLNVGNMARHVTRNLPRPPRSGVVDRCRDAWLATKDTLDELVKQERFQKCRIDALETPEPWYLTRRVIHLSIMWGFLGLLGATTLDLLFKVPGSHVPLYYPVRLLGTISGLALVYGTTVALWLRMERRGGPSFERSLLSDWLLLWMLWATSVTGFIVEVAVYLPQGTISGYVIFLVHMVLAFELLLLLPFTKFAHAIYRPVALWIHAFWLRRCARSSVPQGWSLSARKLVADKQ